MKQYNLGFIGFGNVGRALARLLVSKAAELREQYGIEFRVVGVASRRLGWLTAAATNGDDSGDSDRGFEVAALLANPSAGEGINTSANINDWHN